MTTDDDDWNFYSNVRSPSSPNNDDDGSILFRLQQVVIDIIGWDND